MFGSHELTPTSWASKSATFRLAEKRFIDEISRFIVNVHTFHTTSWANMHAMNLRTAISQPSEQEIANVTYLWPDQG